MSSLNELVRDVVTWSHRDDMDLLAPKFIKLAESAMYDNPKSPLLVRELEFISTTTATTSRLTMPERFERIRSIGVMVNGEQRKLQYQAPQQLRKRSGKSIPTFYTVVGSVIELDVIPDNTYQVELQYFRKLIPLSETNQFNEILLNHYNIYLFGALSELFSHVLDVEQEQRYTAKFHAAIEGANKADKKGRYGVAPVMSVQGVTP